MLLFMGSSINATTLPCIESCAPVVFVHVRLSIELFWTLCPHVQQWLMEVDGSSSAGTCEVKVKGQVFVTVIHFYQKAL